MKVKDYIKRSLIYVAGLFFMALGVAFSVNSNLGVSPVNSLPFIISQITGFDMGQCVMGVFSVYILMQILILRKEFQWINLTQLIFSAFFGLFVDGAKGLLGTFTIPSYAGQLVMLAVSIVLVAVGVSLYIGAGLVNMPMEGLMHAVNKTFFPKKSFHEMKVIIDCLVVCVSIALSLVFLRQLAGVREGTVLCALLVGKVMKPVHKVLAPILPKH